MSPAPRGRFRIRPTAILAGILALTCTAPARAQSPGLAIDPLGLPPLPEGTIATNSLAPPRVGGYVQFRENVRSFVGPTASLPRARVGVDGPLPMRLSYRVLVEYQAPTTGTTPAGVSLRDTWVRWSKAPFAVTAGQMMTPFSREWTMPVTAIETFERSIVVDALATRVDVGAMAEWLPRADLSIAAGAFNGEGQNVITNRDSTTVFIARAAGRPVAPVSIGGSVATFGSDSTRYGAEASVDAYGVSLRGEFLGMKRRGVESRDEGWYALLVVRTLPWLNVVGRQEELHRPTYAPNNAAARQTTVGLMSDLPGGRVRAILDWVHRRDGRNPVTSSALIGQLQVRFF